MYLNPTLHSEFHTGAGAWVPASFVGDRGQHVCVNKCVSIHWYVCVRACVQRVGQAVEGTETACSRGEVSAPA